LLQAERHPDTVDGEKAKEKAEKDLAFARVAIPDDVREKIEVAPVGSINEPAIEL
jgi:hypothetical protein